MGTGLEHLGILDDGDEGLPPQDGAPEAPAEPATEVAPLPIAPGLVIPRRPAVEATLSRVPLFEGLLDGHVRRIAQLVGEIELPSGEYVFRHGDRGDALYVIVDGAVRISREFAGMGEEALAVLRGGSYFGEMAIIDEDAPRSADAIVHERTRLLVLDRQDLRDLMFVDRELAYELLWRFVRTLSQRLRDSNDRLLMLTATSKF